MDNDCVELCGNKIVDKGEFCDGNCFIVCFNLNVCVEVKLEGDVFICDA